MNRLLTTASLALFGLIAMQSSAFAFENTITDTDPTKDEIVLDFDDDLSDAEIKAFSKGLGLDVHLNSIYADDPNIYIADIKEGDFPKWNALLKKKAPAGWLDSAEENVEYQAFGIPNDPLYKYQWNFKQVNAEQAWPHSTGKNVVVAVIDTGVALEDKASKNIKAVKDLAGTGRVPGYDFVDNDAFPWDGHGHGTHVAGTIAQTTNNKYGVAGLANGAKIMPLRVLNSRGFGQVADIANAIRFAADNGAQVINMSLGGPLPSFVMKRAIKYAHSKGVTVVAAAGNGGKRSPSYPAAYDHTIAVAATQFDKKTTFYSQWGSFVDIAAPGGNTRVDQNGDGRPDGIMQQTLKSAGQTDKHDFLLYMGTSMAAPHVAAAAALVIEQGVTHPDKVEAILLKSASDEMSKKYSNKREYKERYGSGLMQADAAAKSAALVPGGMRLGFAALLAGLLMVRVRRKDAFLIVSKGQSATVLGLAGFFSAGLFFLPFLGDFGALQPIVGFLSKPFAEWDQGIFGLGFSQSAILGSALIPIAAAAFLGSKARYVVAGVAFGFAGFLFAETFWITSDVTFIPSMGGVLDHVWLAANGLIATTVGYLALKRR